MRVKLVLAMLFFLTLAASLSSLIFEADTFKYSKSAESLKEKIESLKKDSEKEKAILFYLPLTPQEIDGYLNEEVLKKNATGFRAIHTRLLNEEIEIALSSDLLYIPTMLRVRIKPENSEGRIKLSISGMSLGHLPIPSRLYPALYRRYPWLNLDYLVALCGIEFKEIRIGKDLISFSGVWSI
jgi:uncharacterized protein YpmS